MSYENAPATKLVNTQCAACGKPLVDAISLEVGMGLVCRKKAGYASDMETLTPAHQKAVNQLIHQVATGERDIVQAVVDLLHAGCKRIAERFADIAKNRAVVTVSREGHMLIVSGMYSQNCNFAYRKVGGRWDKRDKVWRIRTNTKIDQILFATWQTEYAGEIIYSYDKGFSTL